MASVKGISLQDLYDFTLACFVKAGFSEDDAKVIAANLNEADRRGLHTHGVLRIPMYLKRVLHGVLDPKAVPEIVVETPSFAIVDAKNGMGVLASAKAMDLAIEKAKTTGLYLTGVRNSNHFGTAAYYTMKAADANMIGFCCSNTEPLMPAPGGAEKVVGNNPFSVCFPGGKYPHVVVDMAVSAAAIGKIVLADKAGKAIPNGWATDANGVETNDPKEALGGYLLPVGGPKGYGLSLAIDIFSMLMGGGFSGHTRDPFADYSGPQLLGHMFMAINIDMICGLDQYTANIEELIERVKNTRKATGVSEVFLPGEIEYNRTLANAANGVELPEDLYDELQEFAAQLGLEDNILKKYKA